MLHIEMGNLVCQIIADIGHKGGEKMKKIIKLDIEDIKTIIAEKFDVSEDKVMVRCFTDYYEYGPMRGEIESVKAEIDIPIDF